MKMLSKLLRAVHRWIQRREARQRVLNRPDLYWSCHGCGRSYVGEAYRRGVRLYCGPSCLGLGQERARETGAL